MAVDNINALIGPISTGQIDLATGGPSAGFFNSIARGVGLKIVADQNTARPGMSSIALMVRKDLIDGGQVKDYPDLRGKMNAAFATKAIDAALPIEPLVTDAVAKSLAVRWKGVDEITPNRQNSFFMFSEQFAARREVARAYMVAYLRGVRDYYDGIHKRKGNREEIIAILVKHTLVKDRKVYDRMVLPAIDPNGELNVPSIKEALDQFTADGDVKVKLDLDRIVDQSFVRYAQDVLGRYDK